MLFCDKVEPHPKRDLVQTPRGLRIIPHENLSEHDGALVSELIKAEGLTIERKYDDFIFSIKTDKIQDLESASRQIGDYFRANGLPVNIERVSTGTPNISSYGIWLASTDGKPLRVAPDWELQGDGRDFTLFPGTGSSRRTIYYFLTNSCKVYTSEIR